MSIYFTQRQVKDASKQRNGPEVTEIRGAPLGSYVLVYRAHGKTDTAKCTGPSILLYVNERTATVLLVISPFVFCT